jgi:hypothetical protein
VKFQGISTASSYPSEVWLRIDKLQWVYRPLVATRGVMKWVDGVGLASAIHGERCGMSGLTKREGNMAWRISVADVEALEAL